MQSFHHPNSQCCSRTPSILTIKCTFYTTIESHIISVIGNFFINDLVTAPSFEEISTMSLTNKLTLFQANFWQFDTLLTLNFLIILLNSFSLVNDGRIFKLSTIFNFFNKSKLILTKLRRFF